MYDHDNKRPRGFGFITFSSEEAVDAVFAGGSMQTLHEKPIEIKRAVPRDQMAPAQAPRGPLPGRGGAGGGGFMPSTPRSMAQQRPMAGYAGGSSGGAFSPTALAARSYSGLSLGGLNGGLAGDFSRSSSDLLQQMTALQLAAAGGGQLGFASLVSQGLAAHALGSAGGLGSAGLSLGPSGGLLGSPGGQPQQQQQGLLSGHSLGSRLSLGDGFGGLTQQQQQQHSPRSAAALRQNSLEEAYAGAFDMPLQQQHHQQQQQQLLHSPGSHHGGGSLQSYQPREEGAGLAPVGSLNSRDLSSAFGGAFAPLKDQQQQQQHQSLAAAEHPQWSLSS